MVAVAEVLGDRMNTSLSSDSGATNELRRLARDVDARLLPGLPSSPVESISPRMVWEGMLAGAWSIADSFESDGRWFLIARYRSGPETKAALTERERQVLTLAMQGHSNKFTALELGLTNSTVATHLRRGLMKIGASSRLSLLRALPTLLSF